MQELKEEFNSECVIDTARQIAAQTKVKPSKFYSCLFCGELMNNQLMIIGYDVTQVALQCKSCNTFYGISAEFGVLEGYEVMCDVH